MRAAPVERSAPAACHPQPLEQALLQLPLDQRDVVALKIDGELTFAEIACVLGINPNTAASRYRYALASLKARLEEEENR